MSPEKFERHINQMDDKTASMFSDGANGDKTALGTALAMLYAENVALKETVEILRNTVFRLENKIMRAELDGKL